MGLPPARLVTSPFINSLSLRDPEGGGAYSTSREPFSAAIGASEASRGGAGFDSASDIVRRIGIHLDFQKKSALPVVVCFLTLPVDVGVCFVYGACFVLCFLFNLVF